MLVMHPVDGVQKRSTRAVTNQENMTNREMFGLERRPQSSDRGLHVYSYKEERN